MSKTVIKIENLSKLYRLGQVGTGTISHDLNRWFAKMRGKEDPFAAIAQVNDRTKKAESDYAWALKDINFEVKQGDVLGIVGKNGAGKSTLLKLLSRVTAPTTGEIKISGRIAALLEVGTGMHPEMTARENIYLNGAILGMRKQEINKKFDEIIEFSGCALYVDTPIKRFSSGMRVRLGFAVAAFLEPEILIVDEVLAVGDYEFQKKAIGKMQHVSKDEGRTVLFVSHNMGSIKQLCKTGLLLKNGEVVHSGNIAETINLYQNYEKESMSNISELNIESNPKFQNENIKLNYFNIEPTEGSALTNKSGLTITYRFENYKINTNIGTSIEIKTLDDTLLLYKGTFITKENNSERALYEVVFSISKNILNAGNYKIGVIFGENARYILMKIENLATFNIDWEADENNTKIIPGILSLDLNPKYKLVSRI